MFNLTIAVGIAFLVDGLMRDGGGAAQGGELELTVLLFVCFVAQWWVLIALSHAMVSGRYEISRYVGFFLCGLYVAFLCFGALAVGLEWRFPAANAPPDGSSA
eukprot:SAG11_NODE_9845_length_876_cov_1.688546_1_plen_103_part_00